MQNAPKGAFCEGLAEAVSVTQGERGGGRPYGVVSAEPLACEVVADVMASAQSKGVNKLSFVTLPLQRAAFTSAGLKLTCSMAWPSTVDAIAW